MTLSSWLMSLIEEQTGTKLDYGYSGGHSADVKQPQCPQTEKYLSCNWRTWDQKTIFLCKCICAETMVLN